MYAKRRKLILTLSVLLTFAVVGTALAASGACGGGYSFNKIYSGWKKKGVLDDVYKQAGITPGVDAGKGKSSKELLRQSLTLRTVIRGDASVTNTTCDPAYFRKLGIRARQSRGTKVWVLKDDISKNGKVKRWWAADCGNMRYGNIKVKMPKPPKAPKKPKGTGVICSNTGQMVDSIQQCVTQTQTTDQDCQAGTIKQGNQCVVIQNQCGNVNVGGDNNNQGGNCNNINICSNVNSPGGTVICGPTETPPPPKCPDGSLVPPSGVCNTPPRVRDDRNTAHTMVGDHRTVWFVVTDDQGDTPDVPTVQAVGHSYAKIIMDSTPVSIIGSGHSCPTGSVCFKGELWVYSVPPGTTTENAYLAPFRVRTYAGGQYSEWFEFTQPLIPVIQ